LFFSISKIERTYTGNIKSTEYPGWLVLSNGILEGVPPLSEYNTKYEITIRVSDGYNYF
jgi:hypothetical protein